MGFLIKEVLKNGVETERLFLRPLTIDDTEDMFEYTGCEESCRFLRWGPHTEQAQARAFIEKTLESYEKPKCVLWGIEEKKSKRLIGAVQIYDIEGNKASVSYILNKAFSKQGYMTETVKAVINLCFSMLNIEAVTAYFAEGNTASEHVMQRCGMTVSSKAIIDTIKGKKTKVFEYSISK